MLHSQLISFKDILGNWQRSDTFTLAFDKNPPKDLCQRDNKIIKDICKIAGITLPKDKVTNYGRSAGMNRAESHGVSINQISRMSKHDINDKLNSSYMTQAPEKTMLGNSGHFVNPDESYYVVRTFLHMPECLKGKAFTKTDK